MSNMDIVIRVKFTLPYKFSEVFQFKTPMFKIDNVSPNISKKFNSDHSLLISIKLNENI